MYFYPGKTRTYRRVFLAIQWEKTLADFLSRQGDFFAVAFDGHKPESFVDSKATAKSSEPVRVVVTPVLSAMGGTKSQFTADALVVVTPVLTLTGENL